MLFAEWVFHFANDLLIHADSLDEQEIRAGRNDPQQCNALVTEAERSHLLMEAVKRRWHRISWFNTRDGKRLRLDISSQILLNRSTSMQCTLCSVYRKGWQGHKSSFKCSSCAVYLCTRITNDSSWQKLWHAVKTLELRDFSQKHSAHIGQQPPTPQLPSGQKINKNLQEEQKAHDEDMEQKIQEQDVPPDHFLNFELKGLRE